MSNYQHQQDDQESQKAMEENIERIEPDPAESRRLLRKIDMR